MSVLWTPEELLPSRWFDAFDTRYLIMEGTGVSQWSDRTGYGLHCTQPVVERRPTVVTEGIGKGLRFDGIDDFVGRGSGFLPEYDISLFAVVTPDGTCGCIVKTSNAGGVGIGYGLTSFETVGQKIIGIKENKKWLPAGFNYTTPSVMVSSVWPNVPDRTRIYQNGGMLIEDWSAFSGAPDNGFGVGGYANGLGTRCFGGTIHEVVAYQQALGDSDRQKVEAYLAYKWNLDSLLHHNHPYLSGPPTVTTNTEIQAVAGEGYMVDTTAGTCTLKLPPSPENGDTVAVTDYAGTFLTNPCYIDSNGNPLMGSLGGRKLATNDRSETYKFVEDSWVLIRDNEV